MDLTCRTALPALSHGQRALWFLDRLAPGNAAYVVAGAVRVLGAVEPQALRRALGILAGRHAALRTTFHDGPEGPVQRVHAVLEPDFAVLDAAGWDAAELVERAAGFAYRGFDLERGPLVRLGLFQGQHEPVLVLALHHAVSDFWSLGVLVRELGALYGEETGGAPAALSPPSLTYLDWVRNQEEWLASPEGKRTGAAWIEALREVPAVLELPADRPRPAVQGFRGGTVELKLEREKARLLARLGRDRGATLAMALLAGFGALLGRWAEQERLLVGMPTTGRRSRELAGLVGYLVNPVAVEIDLRRDPNFGELVARVRESARAAFERQDYPLPLLAERLQPERDPSRPPLFQVMFLLQKGRRSGEEGIAALWAGAAGARVEAGPLVLESLALPDPGAQFDLTLGLAEWEGGLVGKLQYDRDLFDGATVQRLAAQLERLLTAAVAEPERPLAELELLGEGERQQVLVEWNEAGWSAAVEPAEELLHAGFLEQARRAPGATALVVGERRMTYGELAARSLRLAARLRSLGVGPEIRVGVLCGRGVELVVGLLAVLEAGGAYVPLDPAYPAERLELMLADSGAGLVLTRPALRPLLERFEGRLEDLSEDGPAPETNETLAGAPAWDLTPDHLAYVIYTSGSTGRPKGAGITHGSAAALMRWALGRYSAAELSGVLAATSVCFDLSVFELFAPLWAGGTVILAENALALPGLPAADEVTLVNTVPSAMAALVASDGLPGGVRTVNLAGEPLRRSLVEEIYRNGRQVERVWNLYGPTEDTTYSTEQRVDAGDQREPAIGRPLPGGRAYVLDRSGRPVPPGVAGELLLGGAGLARGYLGRGDLTAERFVPDGFGNGGPGARPSDRLYRTGDLVRQRADGTLVYLGRLDHQVKVRGFRIELGEIEAALRSEAGVREAVVVVRGGADGLSTPAGTPASPPVLAAYVGGEGLDPAALRSALAARLPSYMVPSWLVALPELPHLPNGKVDRKALPDPAGEEESLGEAPATPMEEALAEIWCGLLGRDRLARITRDDHFFHLGGHSLLAAQLASRVRQSFGVELPLARLFAAPTLAALAREVEGSRRPAEPALSTPPPAPPITRRPGRGPAPLSFAQERLWFLDQLEPGSAVYNIPGGLRLRGPLDPAALAAALQAIVRRHEALRTVFPSLDGRPVQVIDPVSTDKAELALPIADLTALPANAREAELSALARAEANRPFSLTQSLLLRALLLRLGKDQRAHDHALLITLHHIASDGWSLDVLVRELGAFYRACLEGTQPDVPVLPVQYADYAAWQRTWLESGELERQLSFWRHQLAGLPEALDLPADLPRPAVQSHRGGQLPIELDASLAAAVRELARREEATPFLVLLAGFAALLSRLTGQEDIAVGSPVAGRTRLETEGLIGLFVNTLVLRCDLSGDPPFREALARVHGTVLAASAHQDLPFEKLVEALAPERDRSRSPLFQVLLVHQRSPLAGLELAGLEIEPLAPAGETAKFDLTLSLEEQEDGLAGALEYSSDLYHRATARRLLEQFRRLLDAAVSHPELPISELPLLSAAERQQIQVEWADTGALEESGRAGELAAHGASVPAGSSLPELFAAQARRTPEAIAVLAAGKATTYRELDAWAERLARRLREQGVGPEIPVGVCADRTPRLIAALLGVLKAGGAYVPLDPSYPRERLARMLEDCRVVLAPAELRDRLPETGAAVLDLPEEMATPEEPPASRPSPAAAAGNLAYVIYTSGSTGRPKGVAIEHRSAVALVRWAAAAFSPAELARVLAATSVCFDLSVFELFVPLGLGGTVVLVRDALALLEDGPAADSAVTLINTVPSALAEVVRAGRLPASVRTVNLAGEPLTGALARSVLAAGAGRLLNLYGPSEDTTYSTAAEMAADEGEPGEPGEPTIGRALPGTAALVLDRRQQPAPAGVPGELCLAGAGLARGYLGRPDLTAERFVPAPDGWSGLPSGARIYRTGDLARWLPDGRLAFLGRVDHQVKVRGFRIEPGEVEAALRACPGVREAVVVVRQDPGDPLSADPRLVAYFTAAGPPPAAGELRDRLAARLPGYMVPADWVALASLPLTPNGKVDRRALPAPDLAAGRAAPRAPGTPTEKAVAAIWAEVLGRPAAAIGGIGGIGGIGADDHFFHLGGHSLLATRVAARIRAALGVDLPLGALFAAPTVAGLAAEVDRLRALGGNPVSARLEPGEPVAPPDHRPELGGRLAPASFAQERLWFIDQLEGGSSAYNIPAALSATGRLDRAVFAAALAEVVRRHDSLRTTFAAVRARPVQVIAPPAAAASEPGEPGEPGALLPVVDLAALPGDRQRAEVRVLAEAEARRPFDLARGPLLRAALVHLAAERAVLLLDLHHIISDGWSMGVLLRELAALYEAFAAGRPSPLPELPVQYADYAAWQRSWLSGEVLEREIRFWREQMAGAPAVLHLPADHPRPAVQSRRGGHRFASFDGRLGGGLRRLARAAEATLFMVLMAGYQALLSRLTGADDLPVGAPVAGRNRLELEGVIGFFVNVVVLRGDLSGRPSFAELVGRVRETSCAAFAHQDLPFEKVVEAVRPERDLAHTPLFQVMLALQNTPLGALRLPGVTLDLLPIESGQAKFDLTLSLAEAAGEGLRGTLEYSRDLFEAATAERLLGQLAALLAGAVAEPERDFRELPLLSAAERQQALWEWSGRGVQPVGRGEEPLVPALFEAQAARRPAAPALLWQGGSRSYGELDARANRVAHHLRALGVGPEVVVGVALERSPDTVAGLLGILKAGGAYLPLDLGLPVERLRFMAEDAGLRFLLTERRLAAPLERALPAGPGSAAGSESLGGIRSVLIEDCREAGPETDPPAIAGAGNAAYVIYTSGSAGRPKGVVVPYGAFSHRMRYVRDSEVGEGDRFLHKTTLSFDASVGELFGPLVSGGAVVLAAPGEERDIPALIRLIAAQEVTQVSFTASTLSVLLQDADLARCRSVRTVLTGGEAVPVDLPGRVARLLSVDLLNRYGPTETTVSVISGRCSAGSAGSAGRTGEADRVVPIGRPIADAEVYLLDPGFQPVPVGVAGELCIGGPVLARGYLGRPELTAASFVPHPFGGLGARLYRSGDLARFRPDGVLEFVGRIDQQVKIRGFRVELGEIEALLVLHPAVQEVAVAMRGEAAARRLVAFVVPRPGEAVTAGELQAHLAEQVPAYMVPSGFVFLDALPMLHAGKIDRRKLLDIDESSEQGAGPASRPYEAPGTPVEELLAGIFAEVLAVEQIGIHDDFFDLGGHSLQVTQVLLRVKEELAVELSVRDFFEQPTIAGLALALAEQLVALAGEEQLAEILAGLE
jgi:amino acid adenylation domain-containing protein